MEKRGGILKEKERETESKGRHGAELRGTEEMGTWSQAGPGQTGSSQALEATQVQASPPRQTAALRPAWHLGLLAVCQSSLLGVIARRSSDYTCLITSSVRFLLPPNPGRWGLLLEFVV